MNRPVSEIHPTLVPKLCLGTQDAKFLHGVADIRVPHLALRDPALSEHKVRPG